MDQAQAIEFWRSIDINDPTTWPAYMQANPDEWYPELLGWVRV